TNATSFQLSDGGGLKTIFAQFRTITGQTSAPVLVSINYITAGPTITAFNLTEGEMLSRPLMVTGNASAPLGVGEIEFDVDGAGKATNSGSTFSAGLDVRNYANGIHRVRLLARDTSGNIGTRDANVVISPTPPAAPAITSPATNVIVNTNTINIAGTAERMISVRLVRLGVGLGNTTADANGNFKFMAVPLQPG